MSALSQVQKRIDRLETTREKENKRMSLELEAARSLEGLSFPEGVTLEGIYAHAAFIKGLGHEITLKLSSPTCNIPNILDLFPPVPLVHIKGTFTSLRPLQTISDRTREQNILTPIAPFIVDLEPVSRLTVSVKWFSVVGQFLTEIEVKVSDPTWARYTYSRYNGGYSAGKVKRDTIRVSHDLKFGRRVNWAAGSDNWPGSVTFYWTDPDLSWSDVVEKLSDKRS